MNEKTKRILSYVACGLGGVALGIALLGGLSYCSVSEKAEQTEVNTVLTKRNAKTTTDQGDYDKYTFEISLDWSPTAPFIREKVFDFDMATATPTLTNTTNLETTPQGFGPIADLITGEYDSLEVDSGDVKLLVLEGRTAVYGGSSYWAWAYYSFKQGSTGGDTPNTQEYRTFLATNFNWSIGYSIPNKDYAWNYRGTRANPDLLTYSRNNFYYFTGLTSFDPVTISFQDIPSYYLEQGYADGYDEGETVGYNSGYADGFDDGSDNGLLFTDLGVNQLTWARSDMSWDSQTDTTATMKLFDFKDGENNSYYVSFTDYSLGGGTPMVEVYKNGTASNNIFARIARGTWNNAYTQLEVIPSNYLKFEFAQITTYYHNSIPNGWFTLSGIPANATGYEVGYQTGYREGYLASPGGQATENVFSLFTNAFDSVGGIFNLKIFGFLPLYWFFLTPIFIAIIALILRLVKH